MICFVKQVIALKKKSGLLFTALYLKQCGVALQRFYALEDRSSLKHQRFDVSVSLTRSGIPRIIPKVHRRRIRLKDDRADYLVKLYLSWFSLAKVIKLAKPLRKASFDSITDTVKDLQRVFRVLKEAHSFSKRAFFKYLPDLHLRPLEKGLKWVPSWKVPVNKAHRWEKGLPSNIFTSIKYELEAFEAGSIPMGSMQETKGVLSLVDEGLLWPFQHKSNGRFLGSGAIKVFRRVRSTMNLLRNESPQQRPSQPQPIQGRVASVVEGAGKRSFAWVTL